MSLTLADFVLQLKINLGNRDDLGDDVLTTFVNNAINRVARQHSFVEYERYVTHKVTTGSRYLDLPDDYRDCFSVSVINGASSRMLKRLSIRNWEYYIPYPERYATGEIIYYVVWRNNLEFWRIPDKDYDINMRMTFWPTPLLAATDTCDFTHKDDIILHYAVSEAFMALRMPEDAKAHADIADRSFFEAKRRDVMQSDLILRDIRNDGNIWDTIDSINNPFCR